MVGQTIKELSEVEPGLLDAFLSEQGVENKATRWKYFDETFNNGRNRGFAAVQDGRLVGVIGLIPFRASAGSKEFDTAWTCDWYVDNVKANRMAGIALLKRATGAYRSVFHVGGNATSQRMLSRLATFTDSNGVCEYRFGLRLGYLIRRAKGRVLALRAWRADFVSRIPVRNFWESAQDSPVTRQKGVAPAFGSALTGQHYQSPYHPTYDADYVDWQIGRCPLLTSFTCFTSSGAAALIWRPVEPRSEWRMALSWPQDAFPDLVSVIKEGILYAYEGDADSVTIRVSRLDGRLRSLLSECGFKENMRSPFYAFHRNPNDMPLESMSGLSYLDVDNASLYE